MMWLNVGVGVGIGCVCWVIGMGIGRRTRRRYLFEARVARGKRKCGKVLRVV